MLFSTPLIRAIRQAFPTAYLAYLCNRRTEEILLRNPHLDELFIYEKDELVALWRRHWWLGFQAVWALLARIRRRRFHVVFDLSLGERYSFFLALLGVPQRIGFDFRRRGRFLTHRLTMDGYDGQHVVEYYAQLLDMVGIRLRDRQFELAMLEEDRLVVDRYLQEEGIEPGQRLIGMIPAGGVSWGGQADFRRWFHEGFVTVGRALGQRPDVKILVFGETRDADACAHLTAAIGPSALNLSGRTALGEFVAFIQRCELVIANDGGPIHIAASQGAKTVSIFGPVDPDVYGPYPRSTGRHWVVYRDDLPCRPCYHRFKLPPCPYERACLTGVTPEDVLRACEAALTHPQAVCANEPAG